MRSLNALESEDALNLVGNVDEGYPLSLKQQGKKYATEEEE